MEINFTQVLAATMVLFAVLNIIGSVPIILKVKRKAGDISAIKATVVSMLIMMAFLFIGEKLINFIGIDVYSFAVAGSFVLLFLALEMILGINIFNQDESTHKTASIVPIAFPLIAGAGSMTTVIALRAEYAAVNIAIAIVINMIFVYLVLKLTTRIERFLGEGGIAVLQKVFGIILLAIAVKLFSSNVKVLFN